MNNEDFNTLLTKRLDSIEAILRNKAKEYATDDDRLHNFKRAAQLGECTPAQALKGMWLKHLVSVFDIIDDNAKGIPIKHPLIDEKLGDAINYLILLEALLKDNNDWPEYITDTSKFTPEEIEKAIRPGQIIRTTDNSWFKTPVYYNLEDAKPKDKE